MRAVLKSQLPQFARCMVEKMLTYSLGRGLGSYDRRTVDEIDRKLGRRRGIRFQSLIYEVVHSLPFQSGEEGERTEAMMTRKALPRRAFLRGMGTAVALPFLDAMVPAFAAPRAGKPPVRMAFVYVPNGIDDERDWNPEYEGKLGELPRILKPLEPFKDDILMLGNLTHNTGRALLDGAGDHGRCCGSLSHRHPGQEEHGGHQGRRLHGSDRRQPDRRADALSLARNRPGRCAPVGRLRFRLLLRLHQQSGVAERDAAAAADSRPARSVRAAVRQWRGAESRSARARRRSTAAAFSISSPRTPRSWRPASGPTDRRKLDEYLSSIREVELQMSKAEKDNAQIDPHMEKPYGVPADFAEHYKLMTDMMTIAFQADLTRVMTFLVTHEGTSRAYREIGIPDGHHPLTHHRNQADLMEKVAQINCYQMLQFAGWVEKLKSIKEGDGSLLDNCMIVYGAGLSDGNRHAHEDLPTLIAGRAAAKPSRPDAAWFIARKLRCAIFSWA